MQRVAQSGKSTCVYLQWSIMLDSVWIALILGLPHCTKFLYFPIDAAAASSAVAPMAGLLAPLLSIATLIGSPLSSIALSKKRFAAAMSRFAVSRKSTVLP